MNDGLQVRGVNHKPERKAGNNNTNNLVEDEIAQTRTDGLKKQTTNQVIGSTPCIVVMKYS
jgi:hypothetical protein